ncbi:putative methyltransferase-domain-containing protein [Roridomyces roridus]|uniref:Methyltransferase-domain-containing protein n=1 Tax=Roridomyces roridus TaxID=1738132 RepID=A0AAD7BK68_9AGAR|nr:putative methyltransferase-domain-containing protein [Roridomyces roridus]
MDSSSPIPQPGLIRLPPGSERVHDAEEELFVLYSKSTPSSDKLRGLGYLDSHSDTLTLTFELKDTPLLSSVPTKSKRKPQDKTVEIELVQDKTALRSRTGDTGSVVWKASIDFAQLVLEQYHRKSPDALFDFERLADSHILELGSGTGLLSIALSPLVRQYTATDMAELVPLIRKNLCLNFPGWPQADAKHGASPRVSNVFLQELNWETLYSIPPARRTHIFPSLSPAVDLVLLVDCIYHPSLLSPLLTAIDHVSTASSIVLVMMELRAEDVTREFLEGWLALGNGDWEIWHVADGQLGQERPYVMWVGWKTS